MKFVDLFRRFLLYLLKLVNGPEEQSPALPPSKPATTVPTDAGGSVTPTPAPAMETLATNTTNGTLDNEPVLARTGEIVDKEELVGQPLVAPHDAVNLLAAVKAVEEDPVQVATSSPEVREPVPLPSPIAVTSPKQDAAFTILEPGIATVPVRRFFSRLTVREAAPLTEDAWPMLPVERFFLSLSNPPVMALRGRGPAVETPKALHATFAEFVWD